MYRANDTRKSVNQQNANQVAAFVLRGRGGKISGIACDINRDDHSPGGPFPLACLLKEQKFLEHFALL